MKKILLSALVLALPALASAQVQLISGYNFGQFLGGGYPSLDGTSGDPVPSIGSNYRLTSQAPGTSSGDYVGNNGTTGNYSTGFSRLYWDGTNGSSSYNYSAGVQITANDSFGVNTVNGQTVQGYTIAAQGDGLNLALTSNLTNGRLAFVTNTSGFADYDPTAFVNGGGVTSDDNLTFAAAVSAPVTISWFLNGSGISFASTSVTGASMTSYSVDLPAGFYGISSAVLVGPVSGAAPFDNVQFNGVSAIPEPSTYAACFGAAVLGLAAYRRRKQVAA